MEARALKTFKDLKDKEIRKKGDVFEATPGRLNEINTAGFGPLAEPVQKVEQVEEAEENG